MGRAKDGGLWHSPLLMLYGAVGLAAFGDLGWNDKEMDRTINNLWISVALLLASCFAPFPVWKVRGDGRHGR